MVVIGCSGGQVDGTFNRSGTTSITFYLVSPCSLFVDNSVLGKLILPYQHYLFHTFLTNLNVFLKGVPLG